jgi:prolyl-tRNA editing enzyme YbaK/EbsC (Cys-tRNA(Pro) deacylase)
MWLMTPTDSPVVSALEALGVAFELIDIDPTFADTSAFCEKYDYPMDKSANTILVASKRGPKKYAACVVLATNFLDVNKRVRKVMGVSRASFASSEEMIEVTGMQVGGVTPFSLPEDLPLYVDDRIMSCDWIILGGGGRNLKIKTSPEVFTKLGAEIVEGLGMEPRTGGS